MKKLIVVADFVNDSLICQETRSIVEGYLKSSENANISFVLSSLSTINTAFILSCVIGIEEKYGRPGSSIIFQNTDLQVQTQTYGQDEKTADFLIIKLMSGIYVCGPNVGYDFSLIKDKIDQAFVYKDLNKVGQFNLRHLYSRICAHLMDEMEDELDLEEVNADIIPKLKGYYIGYIDSYGNIKTTITYEDFKGKYEFGDIVSLKIKNIEKKAKYVESPFKGNLGELVIYPGHSGKKDNQYLEISIYNRNFSENNSQTAVYKFDSPITGLPIEVI